MDWVEETTAQKAAVHLNADVSMYCIHPTHCNNIFLSTLFPVFFFFRSTIILRACLACKAIKRNCDFDIIGINIMDNNKIKYEYMIGYNLGYNF